jgi:hypothetical protein
MAGTLVITTLSDGTNSTSATNCIQGSAKAWINFNGTGTPAIRASYNVSSITDNGTGDYTINFTNAFADINYSTVGFCGGSTGEAVASLGASTYSTSAVQVKTRTVLDAAQDPAIYCVAIFR